MDPIGPRLIGVGRLPHSWGGDRRNGGCNPSRGRSLGAAASSSPRGTRRESVKCSSAAACGGAAASSSEAWTNECSNLPTQRIRLSWWLNTAGALYPSASAARPLARGAGGNLTWIDPERISSRSCAGQIRGDGRLFEADMTALITDLSMGGELRSCNNRKS